MSELENYLGCYIKIIDKSLKINNEYGIIIYNDDYHENKY